MKKFEIILWDVDNTLLNFTESEEYSMKESFRQFGMEINPSITSLYAEINRGYWRRLEKGEIDKDTLQYGRFFTLFQELKIEGIDIDKFQNTFQTLLGSVFFYQDDSFELCKKLSVNYKQYAVTNGVKSTQDNKMLLSGFDKIMDGVFISEEIGFPKPDIRFFQECFQRMGSFDPAKVIIVGDSLSSDIKGGNHAGISACWYNPQKMVNVENVKVDYEIQNLWQLEDILKRG